MILSRIAAESFAEGAGEAAGVAEACQVCDLGHGILPALYQGEAFVDAVFFEVSGDCFSGHFFEEAAADFSLQVNLVSQFLKGNYFCKV